MAPVPVLGPFVPIPGPDGAIFADLLIAGTSFYEIKPIGSEALASFEATEYVDLATSAGLPYSLGMENFSGDIPDVVPGVNLFYTTSNWAGAVTYIPHPNTKSLVGAAAAIAAYAIAPEVPRIATQLGGRIATQSMRYLISGLATTRVSGILLGR